MDAIRAFRAVRSKTGLTRRVTRCVITTFGNDFATTSMEFVRHDDSLHGRQSQTWVRLDVGWRIVAAHISFPR